MTWKMMVHLTGDSRASGSEDSGSDSDSDSEVEMTGAGLGLEEAIFDKNAFEMLLMGNQQPGVFEEAIFLYRGFMSMGKIIIGTGRRWYGMLSKLFSPSLIFTTAEPSSPLGMRIGMADLANRCANIPVCLPWVSSSLRLR